MKHATISLLLLALMACAKNQTSALADQSKLNQMTPNIAYVLSTYEDAWQATLKVIQYDFLLPIEIKDKEKGYFSTSLIKEYTDTPPRRYRVSGDLSSDDHETMIKLYKSEQIQTEEGIWRTRLSNLALEMKIVHKIQATLKKNP